MRISDWSSDVCSSDLQDALRTAFDDGGRDAALADIGKTLGCEQHRHILLPERLQPFPDARGEERIVKQAPGLVQAHKCRPAIKALLDPMEKIGQEIGRASWRERVGQEV